MQSQSNEETTVRVDELKRSIETVEAYINGTSTYPAADALIDLRERLSKLKKGE